MWFGRAAAPYAVLGLAVAALVLRGAPWGWFGGAPLSTLGIVALALVVYASLALPRIGTRASTWLGAGFAAACALKLVASATAPPVGVLASYWASAAPGGAQAERSTDFGGLGATRIDRRLDLSAEQFPVHFFNDAARFNFGQDVVPGRDQLPFFVRWEGYLLAPSDGAREFQVQANGTARAWLDDQEVSGGRVERDLSQGLHALRVEYARPEAQVPRLALRWQRTPGGPFEPVAEDDIRWRADASTHQISRVLGLASDVILAVAIAAWLGIGALTLVRAGNAGIDAVAHARSGLVRAALGALPLLFLGYGLLAHAPLVGRATILSGLDDWLVYESAARDIVLNGPLMDAGQRHAPPFYGQPLYPYALALAHQLTGEGLFGPLALQFAALGLVVVLTGMLARTAFGARIAGLAAVAGLLLLLQVESEHFKVARQLFTENAYMPFVLASLTTLVGLATRQSPPKPALALVAGLLLGITAIARSQFLLFVPFALLVLAIAWRKRAPLPIALMLVGLVLAVAPVTARNWLVSGQFVPISSSGGASLLEFHRPPPGLIDPAALARDPLYESLHLDQSTRTVVAFIRADPRGYLATLVSPFAHTVGLQGRNDPGVYWPLLLTSLAYLASFAFPPTRRLHVWPIHAFVVSHLVVLMLFEADTYGYRLVVPMYAPMMAVAAQVPLAALRSLFGGLRARRAATPSRRLGPDGFAVVGWSLLGVAALGWQAKTLVDQWPRREASLHGLAGVAAEAATAADATAARAVFVASIDGTPRRFGSGTLPGMRYPWFKWFDPVRSLPLPPPNTHVVYVLNEITRSGRDLPGDLTRCLGAADASGLVTTTADEVQRTCAADLQPEGAASAYAQTSEPITFDGLARIRTVAAPKTGEAGAPLEARLLWQPLVAHPTEAQQLSLQLDDPQSGEGTLWGNGTLDAYPVAQWNPDEPILSRVPIATDATALPQSYRLTLGFGASRSGGAQATATWQGVRVARVPLASIALTPGASAELPRDMRPIDGFGAGGIELIGMRPLPEQAAVGSPLRIGFLWRVAHEPPSARELTLRFVTRANEVVQETRLPLFGGRVQASALRAGNVVRDEQSVPIGARVPVEAVAVELRLADQQMPLGEVVMTGRGHNFDPGPSTVLAQFGDTIALESARIEPATARANQSIKVGLTWRARHEMQQAYKVFVHVLDAGAQQVVAQRDAEPQDGRAPTTGWVAGERIDDEYPISLPASLDPGEYPIEVGLYDPKSGERLRVADGETRALLDRRLRVGP